MSFIWKRGDSSSRRYFRCIIADNYRQIKRFLDNVSSWSPRSPMRRLSLLLEYDVFLFILMWCGWVRFLTFPLRCASRLIWRDKQWFHVLFLNVSWLLEITSILRVLLKAIQVLAIQVPHRPQQIQICNHYFVAHFHKEQLQMEVAHVSACIFCLMF